MLNVRLNTPTLHPNTHTHARLIVTLPAKANTFKKRGAIGLKKNVYVLPIIDIWSRYFVYMFIYRKKSNTRFDENWKGVFIVMVIFTNEEGKFNSERMIETVSILNVHNSKRQLCRTAKLYLNVIHVYS